MGTRMAHGRLNASAKHAPLLPPPLISSPPQDLHVVVCMTCSGDIGVALGEYADGDVDGHAQS